MLCFSEQFDGLRRHPLWHSSRFLLPWIVIATLLAGCACFPNSGDIADRKFSIYHPRSVVIYKPVAGVAPADDRIFIYLAIQNDGKPDDPLCFACWDSHRSAWFATAFGDLTPVISVENVGSPIVGSPEVHDSGVSGRMLRTGRRYPDILPDATDFPLNEANYSRAFAIVIQPDRSNLSRKGRLDVSVTLARAGSARPSDGPPQRLRFSIPVSLVDQFRPEAMTVEPSESVR